MNYMSLAGRSSTYYIEETHLTKLIDFQLLLLMLKLLQGLVDCPYPYISKRRNGRYWSTLNSTTLKLFTILYHSDLAAKTNKNTQIKPSSN